MKIVALQAENVKKLVAVEIRPDGNLVQITGKNGQGKTSVLDSIWWALAGATHIQAAPIRNGALTARIRLDLGEIVVTRTFKNGVEGPTSALTVENADGSVFKSPQSLLDGLLGSLTFDPLAFSRMSIDQQFNTMKKFAKDVDFDAYQDAHNTDYALRTETNRKAKEARAAAAQIVVEDGPRERVDEAKLLDEYEAANEQNAEVERRISARQEKRRKLEDYQKKAAEAQRIADQWKEGVANVEKELEALPLPGDLVDLSELKAKVGAAREINYAVGKRLARDSYLKKAEHFEHESACISERIAKRNAEKDEKVAMSQLPIPALGFGDRCVLLNGLPLNQASDAEQLRASIAIAMALNPKLRVIRVRDGSLLDEESLALLGAMADEKDYQVWVERVDSSGKVGFVLEDGHLKEQQ